MDFATATELIVGVGHRLDQRGPRARHGGKTIRSALPTRPLAITASGAHKGPPFAQGCDSASSLSGAALDGGKPLRRDVTALSDLWSRSAGWRGPCTPTASRGPCSAERRWGRVSSLLRDYEVLKAYPGVATHQTTVSMPLVEKQSGYVGFGGNNCAMFLQAQSLMLPAFYIRGHGLYAWGPTIAAAESIVEASEFSHRLRMGRMEGSALMTFFDRV